MPPDRPSLRPVADRRYARDMWNQLNSKDIRLLDELAFLSRCTARNSPTKAHYCVPGRTYLAQRLHCSTTTISRRTSHLQSLGLIAKRQRRQVLKQWQTCIYRLVTPIAWKIAAAIRSITQTARRVSKTAHIASSLKRRVLVLGPKEGRNGP